MTLHRLEFQTCLGLLDFHIRLVFMPSVIGVVAVILFILYVVLPLVFRYSSAFQRQLVFLPYTSKLNT